MEEQEILESFISDAEDWGEKFVGLAFEVADNKSSDTVIGEVFRGVHSLKGGASFLTPDEPRLGNLCAFCHSFETFLDGIRKGVTTLNRENRDLMAKALYALNDDIVQLKQGNEIGRHDDLMAKFHVRPAGSLTVIRHGSTLMISVNESISGMHDNGKFNELVEGTIRACPLDTRVVIDLKGESRLSSSAIGAIISMLTSAAAVTIVRPPAYMKLIFKRFRFEDLGIKVRDSLEECWD
jgi:anti-anti-sigma regulatory factor